MNLQLFSAVAKSYCAFPTDSYLRAAPAGVAPLPSGEAGAGVWWRERQGAPHPQSQSSAHSASGGSRCQPAANIEGEGSCVARTGHLTYFGSLGTFRKFALKAAPMKTRPAAA
jgi:hypothetical protein